MSHSISKADFSYQGIDRDAVLKGDVHERDPELLARSALRRAVTEIHTKNNKRSKKIKKLRYLIYELESMQPAELKDISDALGQSKNTTRKEVDALVRLDLVVKTVFENNTLYCLNGRYKKIISENLIDGLLN